jgi:hypothetical protein
LCTTGIEKKLYITIQSDPLPGHFKVSLTHCFFCFSLQDTHVYIRFSLLICVFGVIGQPFNITFQYLQANGPLPTKPTIQVYAVTGKYRSLCSHRQVPKSMQSQGSTNSLCSHRQVLKSMQSQTRTEVYAVTGKYLDLRCKQPLSTGFLRYRNDCSAEASTEAYAVTGKYKCTPSISAIFTGRCALCYIQVPADSTQFSL